MSNSNKEYYYLPNLKEVVDNVIMHALDGCWHLNHPTREYVKCIDYLLEFWRRHLRWQYDRYMEHDDDYMLCLEYEEARNELEEVKREWEEYKDIFQI